jgi:hypothetical protein
MNSEKDRMAQSILEAAVRNLLHEPEPVELYQQRSHLSDLLIEKYGSLEAASASDDSDLLLACTNCQARIG